LADAPAPRVDPGPRVESPLALPARVAFALLLPHIRRYWWLPLATLALLLLSSAAQVGLAWSLKLVIDAVTAHDLHRLAFAIGAVILLGVFLPPCQSGMQICRSVFGGRLARDLRDRVFSHLLLAPAAFHDRRHSGELQSRLADDVATVENMVSNDCVNLLQQPLLALASFGYLLTLNAWLALTVAALGPALYVLNRLWGPTLYARSRRVHQISARLSQFAIDALGGIQPIKALRAERAVTGRYRAALGEQYAARVGEWGIGNLSGAVSGWLSFAPFVIIFAVGGLWAAQGRLSLGALMAAVQLMNNVVSPFGNLAAAWRGLQTGRASLDRLGELLAVPAEELGPEGEPAAGPRPAPPALALRGVAFAYAGGRPVLRDLSFEVPAGGFAALVGPNGSGKSTLAKLLLRFYPPEAGEITWAGQPLAEIPPAQLRARIAYLPQEPFLIDASVADNLRLGAADAGAEALRRVLERVGLPADEEFLAQEVGERGKRLSGGQRLRLALARSLLADAPVWILDEPSAALDAEAAAALRQTLAGLRGERTVLVISHSPDLVDAADVVVPFASAPAEAEAAG